MWKTILGGASQLGVGLVNNAMAQQNASEQRAWQEKMWSKQNAYNDPSAVADRMRKAGLNPYGELSATPAASVGTGAVADTVPLSDPLSALKTISEVENINATTGRIETETDKILKEISLLDIAKSRGLMENKEYERRLKELFEEWDKANPYTTERLATEADARADLASADLNKALAETENELRDVRKNFVSAQTDTEKSKQNELYASALLKSAQRLNAKQDFEYAKQKHPLDMQILQYLRDQNASEADIKKFEAELAGVYNDPDATWEDWQKVLMDMLKKFNPSLSVAFLPGKK